MKKLIEIVVYILALIGLACFVKHIRIANCKEGCCLCGSLKTKVQGFKTKVQGEKETGSRYGSNPVKY